MSSQPADSQDALYKAALDNATAALAAQASDLSTLQGKAKDTLGFATLAATFAGGLGKITAGTSLAIGFNTSWAWPLGIIFLCLGAAGVYAIWPRDYAFVADTSDLVKGVDDHGWDSAGAMYRSMATKLYKLRRDNEKQLARIARAAKAEYVLLVLLTAVIIYATVIHPTKGT